MTARRIFLGTGWKMNKTVREALDYTHSLIAHLDTIAGHEQFQLFVVPPFTAIDAVKRSAGGRFWVGAQNMHWARQGAFTGEISAPMLSELGVDLVELGHAERRMYFNETDEAIQRKVQTALEFNIRPLVCVGEQREERAGGRGRDVVEQQVRRALQGTPIHMIGRLMLAYEPVWAIGEHGTAATAGDLRIMTEHIRRTLADLFSAAGASIAVLYGGTVNEQNAAGLLMEGNADGLFIGRAAWQADGFAGIIRACAKANISSTAGVYSS
ncbi:MAG: triose-phosphate isomerase [Acidobacteriia bacterium]|nr:triose-phosphate isomerase [Terriglobia bacterium]